MFTGIVQGLARVVEIEERELLKRLTITFPNDALKDLQRGASIAINGCCLTVTEFSLEQHYASFDVMQESLRLTNLDSLDAGSLVNFERAAKFGDEIGGHLMSGHISATSRLIDRIESETNCELVFDLPKQFKRYVMPKGFIGLNGCSLTVGEEVANSFSVHLIPETLAVTTFGAAQIGDVVNVEIDPNTQAIIDTVERYMRTNVQGI